MCGRGSCRRAKVVCENTGSARPLLVKVTFVNEILMLAMGTMRAVMTGTTLHGVLTTALTPLERARVAIAVDCTFVEVTAASQFVFDLV